MAATDVENGLTDHHGTSDHSKHLHHHHHNSILRPNAQQQEEIVKTVEERLAALNVDETENEDNDDNDYNVISEVGAADVVPSPAEEGTVARGSGGEETGPVIKSDDGEGAVIKGNGDIGANAMGIGEEGAVTKADGSEGAVAMSDRSGQTAGDQTVVFHLGDGSESSEQDQDNCITHL